MFGVCWFVPFVVCVVFVLFKFVGVLALIGVGCVVAFMLCWLVCCVGVVLCCVMGWCCVLCY